MRTGLRQTWAAYRCSTGLRVVTRGLVHIYHADGHDVAALSGIDLVVAAGERLALLGPSGAGKSTLLILFGGLLRPSAGRLLVDVGRAVALDDVGGALDLRQRIGGDGQDVVPAGDRAFVAAGAFAVVGAEQLGEQVLDAGADAFMRAGALSGGAVSQVMSN